MNTEMDENVPLFFFELIISIVLSIVGVEFIRLNINSNYTIAETLILGLGSILLLLTPVFFIAYKLGLFTSK